MNRDPRPETETGAPVMEEESQGTLGGSSTSLRGWFVRKGKVRFGRILLLAALSPVLVGWAWYVSLPCPLLLRWRDPPRTSFMEYRIRQATRGNEELQITQTWVALADISPNLRSAVLVAEDDRFNLHQGIDWRALAEEVNYPGDTTFSWWSGRDLQALGVALRFGWQNRAEIKGRSTITQQLAKNLFFTPERSLVRKLNEAVVAQRLEFFLPKDRILELYLNTSEWGPGIFGVEAAAQTYFGRSARSLTLNQSAALAATLPHPLTSNPAHRPGQMAWRKELILRRLGVSPPPPPPPEGIAVPPAPQLIKTESDTVRGADPVLP